MQRLGEGPGLQVRHGESERRPARELASSLLRSRLGEAGLKLRG